MINPVLAYRPASFLELECYRDRIGYETWHEMEAKVFLALDNLQPDNFYDISKQVKEEQQELFVKCCCAYILEQAPDCPHPVCFRDGNIIKRY